MLFPVGPQSPAVYWRRRLFVGAGVVLVVVLLALTVRTLLGGSSSPQARGATPPATATSGATAAPTTPGPTGSDATTANPTPLTSPAGRTSALSSAAPAACTAAQLRLTATVAKSQYGVGDQPVVGLQVTNTGSAPCVQDVADSQIELRIYNGASRVWGSHDCKIEPGTLLRTFAPGQPAVFTITWSELSSQPKCAGTRQHVGVGTYTVYASLAGHPATAAQFTIS